MLGTSTILVRVEIGVSVYSELDSGIPEGFDFRIIRQLRLHRMVDEKHRLGAYLSGRMRSPSFHSLPDFVDGVFDILAGVYELVP